MWRGGRGDAGIDNCGSLGLHPRVRKLVLPPWTTGESGLSPRPFPVVQKVISVQSLPPPLPSPELLGLLHTSSAPSASQTTAPGTAMLNLAPSKTAPRPILHCPPVPGPQPLRERSDLIPLGQIAQPPPPLTWAGLLRDRRDTGSQTGSTQLTAPGPGSIYGCPHPLLPVLRNFWKVGNASGELRGSQKEKKKMPKTSPKPPRLPPLCLRAALPAPGSYCPLVRLGWGRCSLEPGHPWTPAPKFCSQGPESASQVVHTSVLWSHISLLCTSRSIARCCQVLIRHPLVGGAPSPLL